MKLALLYKSSSERPLSKKPGSLVVREVAGDVAPHHLTQLRIPAVLGLNGAEQEQNDMQADGIGVLHEHGRDILDGEREYIRETRMFVSRDLRDRIFRDLWELGANLNW